MKRTILLALALLLIVPSVNLIAKDNNGAAEQSEAVKALEKKASKDAKKAAKEAKKDGWRTNPGQLPLEKQFDRAYIMQYETLEGSAASKYIIGEAQSVGQSYDAAAQQAKIFARQDIASKIESDVTAIIEASVANEQLSATEAASIAKSLTNSQSFISKTLNDLTTIIECSRMLSNGNIEVRIMLACPRNSAMETAMRGIRKNLEEDIVNFDEKLNYK